MSKKTYTSNLALFGGCATALIYLSAIAGFWSLVIWALVKYVSG